MCRRMWNFYADTYSEVWLGMYVTLSRESATFQERIPLKAFESNLIKKTSVAECVFYCILSGCRPIRQALQVGKIS